MSTKKPHGANKKSERRVRFAWLTIKMDIARQIAEGKYKPGDRVHTVAKLAAKHGVSTTTVRQAINELASEGVLEVCQGRGTIVAPPRRDYDPTSGLYEQARRMGGRLETQIYQTLWSQAPKEAATALGLGKNEQSWEVTAISSIDSEPVLFEVLRMPRKFAERVLWDSRTLETLCRGAYEEFGYKTWEVRIQSVQVSSERAFSDLLGIRRRMIFFLIERLISSEGKPLFWSTLVVRSDRFQLHFPNVFECSAPASKRAPADVSPLALNSATASRALLSGRTVHTK